MEAPAPTISTARGMPIPVDRLRGKTCGQEHAKITAFAERQQGDACFLADARGGASDERRHHV
ncbi:hypothetical protein G6O67_008047 [Ophiocordyceps sinensis]|uniref:Uncharacterized protein n=2 Tax=Ophiocordyceps sinensis TaxID=72228 RepID=A0A8H4LTH0_9HYPO|nr:hypothetical protein OCS_03622 [Ophiocordyceps sinensis CO18]KAF4504617.1 hypothetical protein G6O67_008047 [Ophiocordyceps sinensis]